MAQTNNNHFTTIVVQVSAKGVQVTALSIYYVYTVKPVLVATCIQRPPVLRGHCVMSHRCLCNIF